MLAACSDLPAPFLYRIITMGEAIDDASMVDDEGVTYTFTDNPAWKAGTRVLAMIDVQSKTDDTHCKATLVSYVTPLHKKPVVITGPEIPDTLGTDDIAFINGWYSGGHLNMQNRIKMVEGSGMHAINLMADKRRDTADTLYLTLKHRSDYTPGENEFLSDHDFYTTFPIDDLLSKEDSTVLCISWHWKDSLYTQCAKVKP